MMKANKISEKKTKQSLKISHVMIVGGKSTMKETVNHPHKKAERICRSIQEYETRKIWEQESFWWRRKNIGEC